MRFLAFHRRLSGQKFCIVVALLFLMAFVTGGFNPLWAYPNTQKLEVFLSPGGDDPSGTGALDRPVRSLLAAQTVAQALYAGQREIVIHVLAGTYLRSEIRWDWFPNTLEGLTIEGAGKDLSTFDGEFRQATWGVFKAETGRPTHISIKHIHITRYWSAIVLEGNRTDATKGNSYNTIEDNLFDQIGQQVRDQKESFGVIGFTRSSNNIVMSNIFSNFSDIDKCGPRALYIAHGSSGNIIESNVFTGGCGSVIKFRDGSDDNVVRHNIFRDSPDHGLLTDAYCDKRKKPDECAVQECPSYGNKMSDNRVEASHPVRLTLTIWASEVPGCPASLGRQRITIE